MVDSVDRTDRRWHATGTKAVISTAAGFNKDALKARAKARVGVPKGRKRF